MASAISSLPVPVSPWIITVEPVGATSSAWSRARHSAGLFPTLPSKMRCDLTILPTPGVMMSGVSSGINPLRLKGVEDQLLGSKSIRPIETALIPFYLLFEGHTMQGRSGKHITQSNVLLLLLLVPSGVPL